MAVIPAARGFGVGHMLLQEVDTFASANGCLRLYLSATPFLRDAIRLYERFGFQRIHAGPHDLFGTPLFTMEKRLSMAPISEDSGRQSHMGGIQRLYTQKLSAYRRFISFFRSGDAIRALLESSGVLRPKLRALDAGAGFGTATFALLDALRHRGIEPEAIDAFDLTPAMLVRFQQELDSRGVTQVRLKRANVLELDQQLPSSWSNYDLIVSTSMLEYVARPDLSQALSVLRARLAKHGTLLVVITRKNWITRVLIEWWWQAARYSREELRETFQTAGFHNLVFGRFPFRYDWHNLSNHVVVARRGETAQDITAVKQRRS